LLQQNAAPERARKTEWPGHGLKNHQSYPMMGELKQGSVFLPFSVCLVLFFFLFPAKGIDAKGIDAKGIDAKGSMKKASLSLSVASLALSTRRKVK
jgi:hypothetical protein